MPPPENAIATADVELSAAVAAFKQSFLDHLFGALGRSLAHATRNDKYLALALAVRERVFETGAQTLETYRTARKVAYLSAEYLPGPHLANNLLSLGSTEIARTAMHELSLDYDDLLA